MDKGVIEAAPTSPVCGFFGCEQIDVSGSSEGIFESPEREAGRALRDVAGDVGPGSNFALLVGDEYQLPMSDAAILGIGGVQANFEPSFVPGMSIEVAIA